MIAATITPAQIQRLQILYGQYERHSLDAPGAARQERLQWASQAAGRAVTSFKDLTLDEGRRLIDTLQSALGRKVPSKSPRRRPTRRDAEKQGTEGRHDQLHDEITLVGPRDIARIQRDLDRLGWDQARLEAFLASPRSPIDRRTVIRTLHDANRVHWALNHIKPDPERRAG
jgi:hypothetical protein